MTQIAPATINQHQKHTIWDLFLRWQDIRQQGDPDRQIEIERELLAIPATTMSELAIKIRVACDESDTASFDNNMGFGQMVLEEAIRIVDGERG